MVRRGPKRLEFRWFPFLVGDFRSLFFSTSFREGFWSVFFDFWCIFKDFGKPNGSPNSIFEAFFSMLFFIVFEHPILVDFSRLRTRKIVIFPRENNDFRKNCVFGKSALVARFCLRFRRPKRRKSIQNSNPKTCCFEASNLKGFFSNFRCILESKNHQKIANIRKK